ncbi:MAG: cysteine desulfurase family protein (TIGR01976 family) [Candidatus Azotimanducaceae bacterium]|jgi:cysteine desulfurase family protein (TIGR01976 family)
MAELDVRFVRQHFPAFHDAPLGGYFFDSAAGSLPCQETIEALNEFYTQTKIQPGNNFAASQCGMEKMQLAKQRWANALGVKQNELGFGPSTTQNIYVLAQAFRAMFKAGDEIVITNQDHESNIGAMYRAAEAAGATVRIWQANSETGLLNPDDLDALLSSNTKLVCFPHASNITGQKNEAKRIVALAKAAGAFTLVDGVSYAPHAIPDVTEMGADIYVFSLYKVYSVHQGVMVVREHLLELLPKQGHYFKEGLDVSERLVPAGPDHAQIAASNGTIDYIETLSAHHGGPVDSERGAAAFVSSLWQAHEQKLTAPLLKFLESAQSARLIGSGTADEWRCPLVSFSPTNDKPEDLAHILCDQNILVSAGHYYAPRLLEQVGLEPARGVIRFSMAHYNTTEEVDYLISKLESLL